MLAMARHGFWGTDSTDKQFFKRGREDDLLREIIGNYADLVAYKFVDLSVKGGILTDLGKHALRSVMPEEDLSRVPTGTDLITE